jgi:hypothetical protein
MATQRGRPWARIISLTVLVLAFTVVVNASTGDKLPEFKDCLKVSHGSTKTTTKINHGHRSAMLKTAPLINLRLQSVYPPDPRLKTQLMYTPDNSCSTSSPILDLRRRMRLCLPAYCNGSAHGHGPLSRTILRKMALLSLSRHAGAF